MNTTRSATARQPATTRTAARTPATKPRPVAFHDDAPRDGERLYFDGSVAPVLRTPFDVSAYTREVTGRIDVDPEALAEQAGSSALRDSDTAELRRDLAFLYSIEAAGLTETRTMYSSWTANEARITAFVASWLWERYWWTQALADLWRALDGVSTTAAPGAADHPRLSPNGPHPRAFLRHVYVERLLPIVGPGWTWLAGERVTAGHMARLAIQEGSLQAAYSALQPRLANLPEAGRVIAEIQQRRSIAADFFRTEARARITRSRGEAITARLVLAVGGNPLRPAGVRLRGEEALGSIFRRPEDRLALLEASRSITGLLPGPAPAAMGGILRTIRHNQPAGPSRPGVDHGL